MTLTVTRDEIKNYLKLSITSELSPLKEQIRLYERKYLKNFSQFVTWMKSEPENFEVWSDYLEWSADERLVEELTEKLLEVENAQHIEIA